MFVVDYCNSLSGTDHLNLFSSLELSESSGFHLALCTKAVPSVPIVTCFETQTKLAPVATVPSAAAEFLAKISSTVSAGAPRTATLKPSVPAVTLANRNADTADTLPAIPQQPTG